MSATISADIGCPFRNVSPDFSQTVVSSPSLDVPIVRPAWLWSPVAAKDNQRIARQIRRNLLNAGA